MKRIWPSLISVSRRKVSRHTPGSRNGSTPSMISINASAVSRMFVIVDLRGEARARYPGATARPVLLALPAARPEILEEFGIGFEHEHVAPASEARLVGLEAAIKRVELGVLLVGAGI